MFAKQYFCLTNRVLDCVQEEAKRLAEQQLDGCQQATQQYQHLLRNCQEAETTALQGERATDLVKNYPLVIEKKYGNSQELQVTSLQSKDHCSPRIGRCQKL